MGPHTALAAALTLALALPGRPCAGAQLWYSAKVASATLASGNESLETISKLTCAAHATHVTWCDLFCYLDGLCLLSDVKVSGFQDDSSVGPVVPCWTKHGKKVVQVHEEYALFYEGFKGYIYTLYYQDHNGVYFQSEFKKRTFSY